MSFSCAVSPEDYRSVDQEYLLTENLGNAYSFCARHCLARVREWAKRYGHADREIVYVFEQGTKGKGDLLQIMERDDFPLPSLKGKDCVPLQAADLVAWEQLKALREARAGTLDKFRRSFAELQRIPFDWGIYTREALQQLCRTSSFSRRA